MLGLPVTIAAELLRADGREPEIRISSVPGMQNQTGTLRVVRMSGAVLTVCRFPDSIPCQQE